MIANLLLKARAQELECLDHFVRNLPETMRTALIAHRGFHCIQDKSSRPIENSLNAYVSAWKSGIYACECDITLTSDGEIILAHDTNWQRLALPGQEGLTQKPVESLSYKSVQSLTLLDGAYIPTLVEVLRWLERNAKNYPNASLIIEIKRTADPKRVVSELLKNLEQVYGSVERARTQVSVMSFNRETCFELQKELDELRAPISNMLLVECGDLDGSGHIKQWVKDGSYSFDLNSPDVVTTIVDDLLLQDDMKLDGIYMQFEEEMLSDDRVRANLKQLCSGRAVGVFFKAGQPDELEVAVKLKELGVKFINTDIPSNGAFFQNS